MVIYDDVKDPYLVLLTLDFGMGHFLDTCFPLCLHARNLDNEKENYVADELDDIMGLFLLSAVCLETIFKDL